MFLRLLLFLHVFVILKKSVDLIVRLLGYHTRTSVQINPRYNIAARTDLSLKYSLSAKVVN